MLSFSLSAPRAILARSRPAGNGVTTRTAPLKPQGTKLIRPTPAKASMASLSSLRSFSSLYTIHPITSTRSLSNSFTRSHSSSPSSSDSSEELATVNWVLKNGEVKSITEKVGMNLLEIAHKHGIELEGACEASLACSTCHIIFVDADEFEKSGEISDEENDMLDLAFGLSQTSRLGCQVILSKELDGMTVRLPSATRNMMVDGHVPKPH